MWTDTRVYVYLKRNNLTIEQLYWNELHFAQEDPSLTFAERAFMINFENIPTVPYVDNDRTHEDWPENWEPDLDELVPGSPLYARAWAGARS
jgi:hypothetical protein